MTTTDQDIKSNDWVTVASLAAFTLQLIRLSIHLVQDASKPSPTDDAATPSSGIPAGSASSQYGSVDASEKKDENGLKPEDEEQPLLKSTSAQMAEAASSTRHRKILRVHSFLAAFLMLIVVFVLALVQQWSTLFPNALLLASVGVLVLELYLLKKRDADKGYGGVQGFLHLWTALVLWLQYTSFYFVYNTSSVQTGKDRIVLLAATLHLLLVVLDGWLASSSSTPPPPVAAESTPTGQLSRKQTFALLKPYFWPDATDSSARMNRFRAIATWFCVITGKACNLTAPLFLGWASTALAHQEYAGTIRCSISYAFISFVGSTLREGQSLVYLKVAQAAYVQLATTAFRHLHSLSLDWHLRKKMGIVLKSMTRGIAACDTLMKVRRNEESAVVALCG
jgi:hypothetical protein